MTSERITQPPSSGTILRIREPQRPLTVKLSGRPEVPRARQSAITLSAHEAPTHPTVHGPLQRLLDAAYCVM